jgi:hypothetical protein
LVRSNRCRRSTCRRRLRGVCQGRARGNRRPAGLEDRAYRERLRGQSGDACERRRRPLSGARHAVLQPNAIAPSRRRSLDGESGMDDPSTIIERQFVDCSQVVARERPPSPYGPAPLMHPWPCGGSLRSADASCKLLICKE